MAKVIHYREKCIGCAYCVELAPGFWSMNQDDGRCDLLGSAKRANFFELELFADEIQKNQRAADICPGKCIRINK
ncbi:ferredoxin [Labilibaculum sp.]|uniref:ferredoxin n=1 Tax=Labilibaculum sp. TaxID=2060723 RepID=UPI00356320DC